MRKPILSALAVAVILLLISIILSNCRKTFSYNDERMQSGLIGRARAFVSKEVQNQQPVYQADNPRNDRTQRAKDFLWSSAAVVDFRGRPAVIVPVHFEKDIFVKTSWGGNNSFRLDNQEKLLVYQDSGKIWRAEVVTWLPDTAFLKSDHMRFTGMALVDDFWGNPINKFRYASDGTVERFIPNTSMAAQVQPKQITSSVRPQAFTQICTYIYGYNYAVGNEAEGVSWVEFGGCNIVFFPDDSGGGTSYGSIGGVAGGGGGGTPSSPPPINKPASPVIYTPTHIITNISDYLKCFQNVAGATFQVTLCVEQPSPGSRNPWVISFTDGASGSGATSAGHSFLVLTETMPGGWSITRNVGFYPSAWVTPKSAPVPGILNNDENSPFNIAAQYSISSNLFFSMLQFINGSAGASYQINNYNCTNYVLDALDQGHIYLPHTIGSWIGGMGVDPGDLGEDIRNYDFTGMTRITTPFLHSNLGTCN